MQTGTKTDVERTTPEEVMTRLARGEKVVFLDTRNPKAWGESDVKLPGGIRVEADKVRAQLAEIPRGRPIVTYCTWPNEGSSARVAQELKEAGYGDVKALAGGLDAWIRAGGPLESKRD